MAANKACLLGLAVVFASLHASVLIADSPAQGDPPPARLRVVTYNMLHGGVKSGWGWDETHLDARLQIAIQELKALDADIVALQEVSISRLAGNVAARIASALGYHMAMTPATDRIFRVRPVDAAIVWLLGFREGSAILSRFSIASSQAYDLPRCGAYLDPRIVLRAEVTTPWGPVHAYSAHTSRDACQTESIGRLVQDRGDALALVMGDFNTGEDSAVMDELRRRSGFIDAFRTKNPTEPGFTVWQRIDAPEPTVRRRVDYIFAVAAAGGSAAVHASRVIFDRPGALADGTPLWPSDHYGVLAELSLRPAPTPPSGHSRDDGEPHAAGPTRRVMSAGTGLEPCAIGCGSQQGGVP